jgi:hypothetical protein
MYVSSSDSGGDASDPRSLTPGVPHRRRPAWSEWLVVVAAVAVAWPLFNWRGKINRPGAVVDAPITLITSDRENLACALPRSIGHFRCAFRTPQERWRDPPGREDLLAPYLTPDRQMFLVPGLFVQPALLDRYAQESPARVPPERLQRFIARCRMRLVERVDDFQARWQQNGNWGPQTGAWVAEPITCRVE